MASPAEGSTLTAMLEDAARSRPHATALASRIASWSYAELVAASAATAALLHARGCGDGARIGLLFRNSPQYVAAYFGVLRAGCTVVPLNPFESATTLLRTVRQCRTRMILGDVRHPEWSEVAGQVAAFVPDAQATGFDASAENAEGYMNQAGADATASVCATPAGVASIMYTSGTTGQPKGIMLSPANLAANTSAILEYLELGSDDCGVTVLPMQFAYGSSVMHTHLAAGARLLIEDSFAYPHAVLERMCSAGVTGFSGVPATYALMLARCDLARYELGRLRYLTQAGGAMPWASIERVRKLIPAANFFVMYGQTEATARITYLPPDRLDDKRGSVGVPVRGVEIAVIRADGGRAGTNETGEVVTRGPNVMLGYLGDVPGRDGPKRDGWLHTGDLGRIDEEGFLYLTGRSVDMIKSGAFRISPGEIEAEIASMPGVADVGVTSIDDELLGQAIKAVVVQAAGAQLNERLVKAHCRRHLAGHKVPKLVEFADSLPYTATGKLKRSKLA